MGRGKLLNTECICNPFHDVWCSVQELSYRDYTFTYWSSHSFRTTSLRTLRFSCRQQHLLSENRHDRYHGCSRQYVLDFHHGIYNGILGEFVMFSTFLMSLLNRFSVCNAASTPDNICWLWWGKKERRRKKGKKYTGVTHYFTHAKEMKNYSLYPSKITLEQLQETWMVRKLNRNSAFKQSGLVEHVE